jgi:hypothetical protein
VDSRELSGIENLCVAGRYGAFSVGVSQRATTVKYILAQIEHHKRISFEDELKKFLSVHGIKEDFSRP